MQSSCRYNVEQYNKSYMVCRRKRAAVGAQEKVSAPTWASAGAYIDLQCVPNSVVKAALTAMSHETMSD